MGIGDKIENMKDKAVGEGKEQVGDATDNERLEAEGQAQQTEGNIKQAGENVKDAFKNGTAPHARRPVLLTEGRPSSCAAARAGCAAGRTSRLSRGRRAAPW